MLRKHPLFAVVLILAVCCIFVCGGGLAFLWARGAGEPSITVDYVAKINERAAAVPEADRAWPLYREASIALAGMHPVDELLVTESQRWDAEAAALAGVLAGVDGELAMLRRAASKPGLGFDTREPQPGAFWDAIGQEPPPPPPGPGEPPEFTISVVLPQLGEFRAFARLLGADAWAAARGGDAERFLADVEAMFGIAAHAEEHPTLISQLVSFAIRTLAYERIDHTISDHPDLLDGGQLDRLAAVLDGLNGGEPYALDMEGERMFFADSVQRMYSDDGQGDGRITARGLVFLGELDAGRLAESGLPAEPGAGARIAAGAAGLVSMSRRELMDFYNRHIDEQQAWGQIPLWDRPQAIHGELERILTDADGRSLDAGVMVLSALMPALASAHISADLVNLRHDATRTAVALARHRAETGSWPESLDDLVPSLLAELPTDRFDGTTLEYRAVDGMPLLYSVGRDREDDGGVNTEAARRWEPAARVAEQMASDPDSIDGDWVFLPAPRPETDEDD